MSNSKVLLKTSLNDKTFSEKSFSKFLKSHKKTTSKEEKEFYRFLEVSEKSNLKK